MTGLPRSAARLSGAIAPVALAVAPKCPLCLLPVAAVVGAALPPQPVLDALVAAAAAAWLVTLLPLLAVPTEAPRADLRVRRFADPQPHRTIALVWRRASPWSATLRRLAATIRSAYPSAG